MKHETIGMANGQIKSTDGRLVNISSLIKTVCFGGRPGNVPIGPNPMEQWTRPKAQKLGSKTLGFNSIHQAMQANSMNFQTTSFHEQKQPASNQRAWP